MASRIWVCATQCCGCFWDSCSLMASQCGREWRRRRRHPSCKGSHIWLQAHLRERGPDLVLIDGVHDNNVVGANPVQRLRADDLVAAARQEFAVLVWVDVDDGGDLIRDT